MAGNRLKSYSEREESRKRGAQESPAVRQNSAESEHRPAVVVSTGQGDEEYETETAPVRRMRQFKSLVIPQLRNL